MAGATLDVGRILSGARIVVLGGTGFLGKLFWSMLLDRYHDVGRIFLVVRPKDGDRSPESRFAREIAPSATLEPLRRTHGAKFDSFLRDKVVPVDGDMAHPQCGLSSALVRELRGTIDAVVNVAGVVDFNPPLDEALGANAFGAQNLVALARALGDVPILHTSTCYVAGTRRGLILEEDPRIVPFPRAEELGADLWDPEREIAECLDLIAQAKHRSDDAFRQSEFAEKARSTLAERGEPAQGKAYEDEFARVKRAFVRERLIAAGLDRATHWGWPNIYLYTKAIGEQVIARSGLPFTIARPASCESTVHYPEPAYNEGINTSAPFAYFILKGEPHILGKHVILDLVPADYVVAGMILAMTELLEGTAKPVYQFGAADVNPCTVQRFGELMGLYKRKHYRQKGTGHPLFDLLQGHYEPSFVDRTRYELVGAPARAKAARRLAGLVRSAPVPFGGAARALEDMARRDAKIAETQAVFEPFTSKPIGPFDCSNTRAVYARLEPADRRRLPWAPESIDWADWMMNVHMPAMEKRVIPEIDRRLKREQKPLAPHATLVTLVDEMADRHGVATALQEMTDDGLTQVSFADVKRSSEAVAARLSALGVRPGDRVALSGQNGPAWPIAFFGIIRAGAIAVPVDPGLEPASFRNVMKESGASAVIWDERAASRLEVALTDRALGMLRLREVVESDDAPRSTGPRVGPDDVACIIFTSGTTARPKGVMLTHANFASLIAGLAPLFPLRPGDAVLSVLPLHHTFEFTCGLLLPLSRGARIAYVGEITGERVAKGLRMARATAMVGVPALWQLLERRILAHVDDRGPLVRTAFDAAIEVNRWCSANLGVDVGPLLFGEVHALLGGQLRFLISGGAALPRETQERFAAMGLPLAQGYGLTEAAPVLTVSRPRGRMESGVGKPVPGVEVKIGRPDSTGVGEILARGPNVMIGYTDRSATDAAIDADGWLHTADLGRIDSKGRLEVVGRIKDVVISTTGENIYPEDVERRLGSVPFVSELAVVGIATRAGERLACLAVPERDDASDRSAGSDRARASLRRTIETLPFGQRPAFVHLYELPLPRTATRKLKRDEVRAILQRIVGANTRTDDVDAEVGPVRAAIAALRGLAPGEVSGHAALEGDLGFDSLLLAELLEALEARFGALDLQRLQACVTVAEVEQLVRVRDHVPDKGPSKSVRRAEPSVLLPEPARQVGKAVVGKLQDFFYGGLMKPQVFGRAYIPHNRNVIVVANHASHLDMGFVRHALGSYGHGIVSLAAQDYFFESGIKRAFFENLTNLKAFDRRATLRQAIRQASEVIERGNTVLLFPEGTRSATGELQEFKGLAGHLALVHGVDILPLHLGGTHAAMPKGSPLPRRREIVARIGPPLRIEDLRRLTEGLTPADAARQVARMAQAAVIALRDGGVIDLSRAGGKGDLSAEPDHPLVTLFAELEAKFRAGEVERPVSYYVTLGSDELAKWTVRVDARACDVRPGKPEGGQADCVLKTSPEIFAKIVRESYVPSPADFLSGAVKSNDVGLLMTFQKVFQLDQAS